MARHDSRVLLLALLAGAPGVAGVLVLLALGDFPPYVAWPVGVLAVAGSAALTLEEAERVLIEKALERYDGNVSKAADALGLSRSALYRRLQRHDLPSNE